MAGQEVTRAEPRSSERSAARTRRRAGRLARAGCRFACNEGSPGRALSASASLVVCRCRRLLALTLARSGLVVCCVHCTRARLSRRTLLPRRRAAAAGTDFACCSSAAEPANSVQQRSTDPTRCASAVCHRADTNEVTSRRNCTAHAGGSGGGSCSTEREAAHQRRPPLAALVGSSSGSLQVASTSARSAARLRPHSHSAIHHSQAEQCAAAACCPSSVAPSLPSSSSSSTFTAHGTVSVTADGGVSDPALPPTRLSPPTPTPFASCSPLRHCPFCLSIVLCTPTGLTPPSTR